jgi:preprotein translocase subunit Sec61beta
MTLMLKLWPQAVVIACVVVAVLILAGVIHIST